jgi:menaquinone-dependent protoporphyrinogen IX oxidase
MKGAIIYKGKYGATRQYAELLAEQLHIPVLELEIVSPRMLAKYDYIIAGASVYAGKLLNKSWLKRNSKTLAGKKLFLFIVCATPSSEKEKLNGIIKANIPNTLVNLADIFFLGGRLIINKLSWIDRLVLKMGASLEKNPARKKAMLQDFDSVKKENIKALVYTVSVYTQQTSTAIPGFAHDTKR